MAWVVAASSLFHSLNTLRPAEKAELDELVYAESGLSLKSSYSEEETKFTDSSGRASSGGQGDNSLARRIE